MPTVTAHVILTENNTYRGTVEVDVADVNDTDAVKDAVEEKYENQEIGSDNLEHDNGNNYIEVETWTPNEIPASASVESAAKILRVDVPETIPATEEPSTETLITREELEDLLEVHHLLSIEVGLHQDSDKPNIITKIYAEGGVGEMMALSKKLALSFQEHYKDVLWDGEFFDAIDHFMEYFLNTEETEGYKRMELPLDLEAEGSVEVPETIPAADEPSTDTLITREQFLEYFRSDKYNEDLDTDDCIEIFSTALKGSSDISAKLFNDIVSDYGATENGTFAVDHFDKFLAIYYEVATMIRTTYGLEGNFSPDAEAITNKFIEQYTVPAFENTMEQTYIIEKLIDDHFDINTGDESEYINDRLKSMNGNYSHGSDVMKSLSQGVTPTLTINHECFFYRTVEDRDKDYKTLRRNHPMYCYS